MHIEDLGRIIVERRALLGLDQRALAELAGISTRALSAIETGQGNPRLSSINAILLCLGLQVEVGIRSTQHPFKTKTDK